MAKLAIWALCIVATSAISCTDSVTPPGGRAIVEVNGIPYGAACTHDGMCGGAPDSCCKGGKCSEAGWCSPKCGSDRDCPNGFFCVDWSGNRCFAACADDRGCPNDFVCEEKSDRK